MLCTLPELAVSRSLRRSLVSLELPGIEPSNPRSQPKHFTCSIGCSNWFWERMVRKRKKIHFPKRRRITSPRHSLLRRRRRRTIGPSPRLSEKQSPRVRWVRGGATRRKPLRIDAEAATSFLLPASFAWSSWIITTVLKFHAQLVQQFSYSVN